MTDNELFSKKASENYMVCFVNDCPLHEDCLRWKTGRYVSPTQIVCNCVNPHYEDVGTDTCPMYRKGKMVTMAKGMKNIFTDDMPRGLVSFIRATLIEHWHRTYYFECRNGSRLITPSMQEHVRQLFRKQGWEKEIHFDEYVEAYEW